MKFIYMHKTKELKQNNFVNVNKTINEARKVTYMNKKNELKQNKLVNVNKTHE